MKQFFLKYIFIFFASLFILQGSQAYTVSPSCPDFTDINASYTEAFTGTTFSPFQNLGVVTGRHTEITAQGTDPYTGNMLALLPPGESKVIRLGNEQIGGEAEALTYHFFVDKDNPILFVKFAVVFEDPGHLHVEQPRFVMRIMDKNGNLIEDCAEYDVSAGAGIPGFQAYYGRTTIVRWRDWTNVGLDMSSYVGQEVQVQFITYDCRLMGHFGYAYFTAKCISNKLQLSACAGNTFTVEAPEGFASYQWSNGDNTRTTTVSTIGGDMNLTCLITSVTGCQFMVSALISSTMNSMQDLEITDTICQGEPYTKNYFNLPPQEEPGTFVYYNTILNPNTCSEDATVILTLNVIQQYYPIKKSICYGESYIENGFNIFNPAVGILRDTLFLKSKASDCDSIVCLELTVNTTFNMPNVISGDANPCTNKQVIYSFTGSNPLTNYNWQVPPNAIILGGQTVSVTIYFTDDTPGDIILIGENGCGTAAVPLHITPRKSYNDFLTDSICAGETYNKNGFNLGILSESGYATFTNKSFTTQGCDSVTTLALFVFPTPTLEIVTQSDSILCTTQMITLHALANDASADFAPAPDIALGDILCSDGSILKPEDFMVSGKTAEGVIFFVDNTSMHGWVVSLQDISPKIWSPGHTAIAGLTYRADSFDALKDLDGYANTQAIRNSIVANPSVAAWAVDFSNGFYLPAMGQLRYLFTVLEIVNGSLQIIGGDEVFVSNTRNYWSSSVYSTTNYYAWALMREGLVGVVDKTTSSYYNNPVWVYNYVRAIKNF